MYHIFEERRVIRGWFCFPSLHRNRILTFFFGGFASIIAALEYEFYITIVDVLLFFTEEFFLCRYLTDQLHNVHVVNGVNKVFILSYIFFFFLTGVASLTVAFLCRILL